MNPRVAVASGTAVVALASPMIVHYEGMQHTPYRDPIGIVTVCAGHTGPDIVAGKTYTPAECAALLARDLAEHNAGLMECVKVPMTDTVHAAMLSFTFNVGVSKFCKSTIARKLNSGDTPGACAELSRWVYAGGKKLLGLERRRAAERALCERKLT